MDTSGDNLLSEEEFMRVIYLQVVVVSFSDDEFVIGPCRSTATHDNDRK